MSLSPIAGPIVAIDTLEWYAGDTRPWRWVGLGVVIAIKAVAAWLLLWLSIKTFDRRMGRVPEARAPGREEEPIVLEAVLPGVS